MKSKWAALAGAMVGVVVMASSASAQSPAERSIAYRQGALRTMGWHMGNMGAQVKGEKPYEKDDFARSATFVSQLAYMPWDGFGPGTEAGAPTKAKPEIWKETDKFKDLQKKLQGETAKLAQVAASGNMDQIKAQFAETGKACSNCHDSFRAK